ncbi:MAG: hypothetical protein WD509_01760 [Candidatus Paceibacterota bacterium]
MDYCKITSYKEAVALPGNMWELVYKRCLPSEVYDQALIDTLKEQVGMYISTGGIFMCLKSLHLADEVYWVTLVLPDGGEHHAPLGLYFDIFLARTNH